MVTFTARRYASAVYAVAQSGCTSVRHKLYCTKSTLHNNSP